MPSPLQVRLERLRGRPVVRDAARVEVGSGLRAAEALRRIAALEPRLSAANDATLRRRADRLRDERSAATLLVETFALVREAARRALGQRPHDAQMLAGLAMTAGAIVEMGTGEGKTLAAVAPTALHALDGRGAHVLTFNDYLARRDAAWMGPVFARLGLTVGTVQQGMSSAERRAAYAADVTYATAKEAGFDRLRELLADDPGDLVQRPFHYAIVDEADSILIDEARVPLVIAGALGHALDVDPRVAGEVEALAPGRHFETDEHGRNVVLTSRGEARLERRLGCGPLIDAANLELLTQIHCALHARVLLRRDVDYIVRDGRVQLVDEFTGRVALDRHLPDGLQSALEIREGLVRGDEGTILGTTTLQHFLTRYPKLAGMTATAADAAEELHDAYGTPVVVVAPHRPSRRVDEPDVVFTHRAAKHRALVAEIARVHATGRPVLVGTASVGESEELAGLLRERGLVVAVLNARRDEEEAAVVAEAGAPGALTISTNMAGRGTDIRLGGRDERARERALALGGLYVIGTNRHESRRIDDQLRGRAGRQGDPGSTRFFVSLEDPLIARYGVNRLIPPRFRPPPQEEPIDHPVVRREIARAQRIVDGENLEIRRTLSRYTRMLEQQSAPLHARRQAVLRGATLDEQGWPDLPGLDADAKRRIALACIDRAWREHLSHAADLREGIHLLSVMRLDPLAQFQRKIIDAWDERLDALDAEIADACAAIAAGPGDLDDAALERAGLRNPTSTWTYVVNDDPFRNQLYAAIGGTAMGLGIVANFPLVFLWWLWERRRRRARERERERERDRDRDRERDAGEP